jgi:hypothetical protein
VIDLNSPSSILPLSLYLFYGFWSFVWCVCVCVCVCVCECMCVCFEIVSLCIALAGLNLLPSCFSLLNARIIDVCHQGQPIHFWWRQGVFVVFLCLFLVGMEIWTQYFRHSTTWATSSVLLDWLVWRWGLANYLPRLVSTSLSQPLK